MSTTRIDDNILFSPSDDGSGEHIPDIYNPELLAAKLPTLQKRLQFLAAALSAYQYLGYDTPPARRLIEEKFYEFKNLNNE